MSRFREARKEAAAAARRRARPSALQMAWLVVILGVGGVIGWLALSPSDDGSKSAAPATAAAPQTAAIQPTPAPTPAGASKGAPAMATPDTAKPAAPPRPAATPLTPAPIPDFAEQTADGVLPKLAPDGREPWQAYGRAYADQTARPRIAIVITGLGLGKLVTETAISTLPPAVALAFSPYGEALAGRVRLARQAGHEVLLMMPMEPQDFPKNDPGPHSLLTTLPAADNVARMHWTMARFPGYVGVVNEMGSKFTASEAAMTPVLQELKRRGLLFMDARTSQYSVAGKLARTLRVPRVINNRYIDDEPTEEDIRKRLEEIENLAKTYGAAAAIGRAYPVTMKTVAAWAADLDKRGFELVPVTAVVNRQPVR